MSRVKQHYDRLLGPVYSWILGDFDAAYRDNRALFERLGVVDGAGKTALDLGSGPGCQSIPLAEQGYRVTAVDFCEHLLGELQERAGTLPVTTVAGDIRDFAEHIGNPVDLVVCMGDTLCHLPDTAAVEALIERISENVAPGGRVILSFRDYVSAEPTGAERFIPVRSSATRIFTCFVEYKEKVVSIHDLVYTNVDGTWQFEVSAYDKIKVDPAQVVRQLGDNGFLTEQLEHHRMAVISAVRPA